MSKPRYFWWGYVRACIRDYPVKCMEVEKTKKQIPKDNALPRAPIQRARRPTENRALADLSCHGFTGQKKREYDGVRLAEEETMRMRDGKERVRLIRLMYQSSAFKLPRAAEEIHVSERTARRWHGEFVRLVASHMGLMDE